MVVSNVARSPSRSVRVPASPQGSGTTGAHHRGAPYRAS